MTIMLTAKDTALGETLVRSSDEKTLATIYYSFNERIKDYGGVYTAFIDNVVLNEFPDAPTLIHPYLVEVDHKKILFGDIRLFINKKESDRTGAIVSSNPTELAFTTLRTQLNALWVAGEQDSMRRSLSLSNKIFAGWLSDTITKRFGLNPEDQLAIYVLSHFYYKTLFFNKDVFSEDEKLEFAHHTIKDSRVPAKFVLSIFDKIGKMGNINDYLSNMKEIVESRRINEINLGTLITIIGTTWYGTNSKEILTVALEHPPTFMAISAVAVTQRFYKKSAMYSLATKFGKPSEIEDYISNMFLMVDDRGN